MIEVPPYPYGLSPLGYWKRAMTVGYGDFDGRSPRSEFWWTFLFNLVLFVGLTRALSRFDPDDQYSLVALLIGAIFLLVPQFSVAARRLHDVDKSAKWLFAYLIPFGAPLLFFYFCTNSSPYENDWGFPPK